MNSSLKKIGGVAAGLAMLIGLSGCGAASPSTDSDPNGSMTVVYIPGLLGNGFYNMVWRGIEEQAAEYGYTAEQQGSSEAFTPGAQTPIVNAVCSTKPTILIISPVDPVAMRQPIQACMDAGVTVVLVDTTLTDTTGIVASVASDNVKGGELAAEYIVENRAGDGPVSIHSTLPEAMTQAQRAEGATAVFEAAGVEQIEKILDADAASAQSNTIASLTAHPDLSAIFEDSGTCPAIAQAIETSGKSPLLVCYDSSEANDELLRSGAVSALVLQAATEEGKTAMTYGWYFLNGRESEIEKVTVVTPILVTTEQADDPEFADYFYQ